MSSDRAQHTSSSDSDPRPEVDQRKRKRMLSNRESARRSRMRKQQHLGELVNRVAQLTNENGKLERQINMITLQYSELESGNLILRTQLVELTERLRSVNSVLLFHQELSGIAVDIPEIPDPLLKPWQLPCPTHAILASPSLQQS